VRGFISSSDNVPVEGRCASALRGQQKKEKGDLDPAPGEAARSHSRRGERLAILEEGGSLFDPSLFQYINTRTTRSHSTFPFDERQAAIE
jgi:hypothetical protein